MKKVLLTFGLCATVLASNAQNFSSPTWTQTQTVYKQKNDAVNSAPVTITADGDVIVSSSFNAGTLSVGGLVVRAVAKSSYIQKLNAAGTSQWAVALLGAAEVKSLTSDTDGNIYAVGVFADQLKLTTKTGTVAATLQGNSGTTKSSLFILKYSKDGALLAYKSATSSVDATVSASGKYFYEASEAAYVRSTKAVWANNKLYFTAQYTGVSNLDGVELKGDYLDYEGFMYVDIPRMSVLSVDASNLSGLKKEYTVQTNVTGLGEQTGVSSLNFAVNNGTLYVASVATGAVVVETSDKTENFNAGKDGEDLKYGFIYSEVGSTTTNKLFDGGKLATLNSNNSINDLLVDGSNVYVAGTYNTNNVFGQSVTFQGGSDSFVAAFAKGTTNVQWVVNSGVNEGDATKYAEKVTGLVVADNKLLLTGYTEETSTHTVKDGFVYNVTTSGTKTSVGSNVVLGLASDSKQVVTSGVNELNSVFNGYALSTATGINQLTETNDVVRNGNVFSFEKAQDAVVVDLQGRVVLRASNTTNLSVDNLVKGVYVLKVGTKAVKFVK
ncbi:T9SS type A sorting domain-containing protein [Hoylesella nanceiensis]|uniref:T9SS type A sorting domain-containing protein n=1 Tax=Hoylesella nanceiensis TaxID=425941 RepID=UPI001CAE2E2F|nr:T9SS type A sorting domain-containing protein [Hoylesella nanceiensis]MBF1427369.1 T9SS type A sorting domain-containing protein [Hoylesella nanceiensis]